MLAKWAAGATYPVDQNLRNQVYRTDPCLARIIDRENPLWEPTLYNGFTYWHPGDPPSSRSYGLPQAQPPEKMASAGADWRPNPWTQLAWMRSYVKARYGSACAALAFWLRHRYY
jgi:hypothetical protein